MKKLVCQPPNPARLLPLAMLAGLNLVLMAMSLAPWLTPSSLAQSTSCNSAWNIVSSPNPDTAQNRLNGVAAVSPSDVWAVGVSTDKTLIEHWNGGNWSVVPSPTPGGIASLSGVSAVSSSDVWAVGQASPAVTLVEHWDGSNWSVVPSPNLNGNLSGVSAVSSSDVWAVGQTDSNSGTKTLIEHWDGSGWSIVPSPSPDQFDGLSGVAAVSSSDVWAVGGRAIANTGGTRSALIEHWDGSSWSIVPSPSPDQSDLLQAVSAVSSSDVWAVGGRAIANTGGTGSALIEHWDGGNWTAVTSPIPPARDSKLNAIAAISSGNIWAVGDVTPLGGTNNTLTEHWDGNSWQIVSSPSRGGADNASLTGVAAASASDIWAVGHSFPVKVGPGPTLVEHFCAPAPASTPTATPTPRPAVSPTPAQLPATGGPPDGRGWAIWTYVLIAVGSGVTLSSVAWRLRKRE